VESRQAASNDVQSDITARVSCQRGPAWRAHNLGRAATRLKREIEMSQVGVAQILPIGTLCVVP